MALPGTDGRGSRVLGCVRLAGHELTLARELHEEARKIAKDESVVMFF